MTSREYDADGFPPATADNDGVIHIDTTGIAWVCEPLTAAERVELADDLEVDGATHVWRKLEL